MKNTLWLALFLLPTLATAQDNPPPPDDVDAKAVNAAIDKGMKWLLTK